MCVRRERGLCLCVRMAVSLSVFFFLLLSLPLLLSPRLVYWFVYWFSLFSWFCLVFIVLAIGFGMFVRWVAYGFGAKMPSDAPLATRELCSISVPVAPTGIR